MRSDSSPRAVRRITGSSERPRIHRHSASPSVPGNITSSTTRSGLSDVSSSRARSPSAACSVGDRRARGSERLHRARSARRRQPGSWPSTPDCARTPSGPRAPAPASVSDRARRPIRDGAFAPSPRARARGHAAQRMPRGRMDQRQIEMPRQQARARRTSASRGGTRCPAGGSGCLARRTRAESPRARTAPRTLP